MAASGVTVKDTAVNAFNDDLKLKKKYKYIQFKLTDDLKQVEIEKAEEEKCTWDSFVSQLPPKDCRYAVFDYHYTLGDSGNRQQLIFIIWCPDTAPIKHKMLYAATKDAIKKKLIGINHELQATDMSELLEAEVLERVGAKSGQKAVPL